MASSLRSGETSSPLRGLTLAAIAGISKSADQEAPEPTSYIDSPVRSGTGRIRNLRQMNPEKLVRVTDEMVGFKDIDPEGWDAVVAENARRAE